MLAALEALVKLESPTEDLQACQDVIKLASDLATKVLGTPAEIRDVNGRLTWIRSGLKALSRHCGKLKVLKQPVLEFLI